MHSISLETCFLEKVVIQMSGFLECFCIFRRHLFILFPTSCPKSDAFISRNKTTTSIFRECPPLLPPNWVNRQLCFPYLEVTTRSLAILPAGREAGAARVIATCRQHRSRERCCIDSAVVPVTSFAGETSGVRAATRFYFPFSLTSRRPTTPASRTHRRGRPAPAGRCWQTRPAYRD